jgi:transposase InsO family protein
LIKQINAANPLWGAARIHGELLKLGFDISIITVAKYMRHRPGPPSPTWRTFIRNHMQHTAAVDMFVVITATFRFLYALLVLDHGRRRILHVGVTENPNQDWLADQMAKAYENNPKPLYLVRDRDAAYGHRFRKKVRTLGIQQLVTAPQSPWQNIFVERVIQSIRKECLDHMIIFNKQHLVRVLNSYMSYYNHTRTHLALAKDSPVSRPVDGPSDGNRIVAIPEVGGLHHRYERRAA